MSSVVVRDNKIVVAARDDAASFVALKARSAA
jgi:uncharacterized protein (TIGR02448 family)